MIFCIKPRQTSTYSFCHKMNHATIMKKYWSAFYERQEKKFYNYGLKIKEPDKKLIKWLDSLSFNNFETKYQHTSIQATPILLSHLLLKSLVIFSHKDFVYQMVQLSMSYKKHLADHDLVKKDFQNILCIKSCSLKVKYGNIVSKFYFKN